MSDKLEILHIIEETPSSRSITFKITDSQKDKYKFLAGQYLTLVFEIDGIKHKRCYSISSPVTEQNLTIAVKRVKGGFISNYLNDTAKVGDFIAVEKPIGNFNIKVGGFLKSNNYVFFAGGSGITPILSMIQSILLKESMSKIVLLYGNEDLANIIYYDKLTELQSKYSGKLTVVHVLNHPPATWQGEQGMLTKATCDILLQKHVKSIQKAKYYICGPIGMMDEAVAALKASNVDKDHIHLEYFTAPVQDAEAKVEVPAASTSTRKEVTVWVDGEKHILNVGPKENIIAAAIKSDVDAPYSCRTGACSSCKAKLVKGKVTMNTTIGLTEQEMADGYILACQSQPLTDDVELKFSN